jgi:transcriptional regulator with XRE-family HTH domain
VRPHPLLRWRLRSGLDQKQAGALVGVTQQDWSRYERARVLPRRAVYKRIVAVTKVTPCSLLTWWLTDKDRSER